MRTIRLIFHSLHPEGAFSLVEVTIAVGLASFCLLSLFGLLPVGLNSNQTSIEQTAAAGIARSIASDLRNTPASGTSPIYGFVIPAAGAAAVWPKTVYFSENGVKTGAVGAAPDTGTTSPSRYRASVALIPPAANQKTTTAVRILVTWPAMANPVPATDPTTAPTKYAGSYDIVAALNRN